MRYTLATLLVGICLVVSTNVVAESGLSRQATVFISVECEDPSNGIPSEISGTGFFVERSGFLLTAHHVVDCFDKKLKRQFNVKSLVGRVGSTDESTIHKLEVIKTDPQADVALLRVKGAPKTFASLRICALRDPKPETEFWAAGFPEGKDYQPVRGAIGNVSGGGGNWSAASDIFGGMSGGPVARDGAVFGIVKGGLDGVTAVRMIIPIYRVRDMIESETGIEVTKCKPQQTVVPPKPTTPATKPAPTITPQSDSKRKTIDEGLW